MQKYLTEAYDQYNETYIQDLNGAYVVPLESATEIVTHTLYMYVGPLARGAVHATWRVTPTSSTSQRDWRKDSLFKNLTLPLTQF